MIKSTDYPYVNLVVHDGEPKIELHNSENEARVMLRGDNIHKYLENLAVKIGYDGKIDELYQLANISDELYLQFPLTKEKKAVTSISFAPLAEPIAAEIASHQPISVGNKELEAQLEQNWQGDLLASVIDEIYRILVKDVVEAAAEMGIGKVRLTENTGNPRFREKVSLELARLNVELIII
jgi:tRNA A37 threonylcarbamoyltransferase TsaD